MESPAQPRAGHQTKGNPMLTIGLFAQQSGLTVKALRHYDEIGLLTPARIDDFTGYRYYSAGQLRDAAIIGTLRGIGLPLAQIAKVLGDQDAISFIARGSATATSRRSSSRHSSPGARPLAMRSICPVTTTWRPFFKVKRRASQGLPGRPKDFSSPSIWKSDTALNALRRRTVLVRVWMSRSLIWAK